MANISKFITKKLPHDKRTRKLWGAGDDTGKYYRCWNCNFTVNSERHPILHGRLQTSYNSFSSFEKWVNEDNKRIETHDGKKILLGKPLYYSDISVGCPHCGSPNYK